MFTPTMNNIHSDTLHDSTMSGSPVNAGPAAYSVSSPYLPGFLLGDHQSHPPQGLSSPRLWSTPGSSQISSQRPPANLGTGLAMLHTPSSSSSLTRRESTRARHGAPPVKSLYSSPPATDANTSQLSHNRSTSSPAIRSLASSQFPATPASGQLLPQPGGSRGDTSILGTSFRSGIPVSPAQSDPFFTQGDLKADDVLDETWVTVLGFPPGATAFILQQFSQYGTIIKHVVVSECNWMHIHYQSKIQAKKALSKAGKTYGGCMRIWVTPCIEKSIMEEKENQTTQSTDALPIDSFSTPKGLSSNSLTPIRPLTAAYAASKGNYEVLQDKHTPRRDAGLVSKLKEYMFGY